MTTKVRSFLPGRLSGAPLWLAFSALTGCSVAAGLLGAGLSSSAATSWEAGAAGDGPRTLSVSLRPGVSLFQAAAQAPRAVSALSRAARGLGDVARLDKRYLHAVSANLLDEGLLLPGPLGLLEVRLEVQPIVGEPIVGEPVAVSVVAAEPADGSDPGCTEVGVPPALVGAYRAGTRLLLLRADGRFVLEGGASPAQTGSYALGCRVLQLAREGGPPLRLLPLGTDGWRDPAGATFRPLTEQHHGDHR